jgi:hypothetical protein
MSEVSVDVSILLYTITLYMFPLNTKSVPNLDPIIKLLVVLSVPELPFVYVPVVANKEPFKYALSD